MSRKSDNKKIANNCRVKGIAVGIVIQLKITVMAQNNPATM